MCGYCIEQITLEYATALRTGRAVCITGNEHPSEFNGLLMEAPSISWLLERCDAAKLLKSILPEIWLACLYREQLLAPDKFAAIQAEHLRLIVKNLVAEYILPDAWFEEMNLLGFLKEMQPPCSEDETVACLEQYLARLPNPPQRFKKITALPDVVSSLCWLYREHTHKHSELFRRIIAADTGEVDFLARELWVQRMVAGWMVKDWGLDATLQCLPEGRRDETSGGGIQHYLQALQITY